MVWADSEFAIPTSSFNSPVPLVLEDPRTGDLVRVCFNKAWLPYIAGALMQLVLQTTWETSDPVALGNQQGRSLDLISLFNAATAEDCDAPNAAGFAGAAGGDEFLLRQNPDNPCELQSSTDGVTWCTWADLSKCLGNPLQPGAGTKPPAPGGGCQDIPGVLFGNGRFVIPVALNSGDTIRLIGPTGAVSDSIQWYCANGNVFFSDQCLPLIPVHMSGDPIPTEPHLSIIVDINGTFYPLGTTGTLTVPGGVSNAQVELICNTSTPGSAAGNFQFELEVCNNQSPTYDHPFNFLTSTHFWTITNDGGGDRGVWAPNAGFSDNPSYKPSRITIDSPTAAGSFTVDEMIITLDVALNGPTPGVNITINGVSTTLTGAGPQFVLSGTSFTGGPINVDVFNNQTNPTLNPVNSLLQNVEIKGTGADPWFGD